MASSHEAPKTYAEALEEGIPDETEDHEAFGAQRHEQMVNGKTGTRMASTLRIVDPATPVNGESNGESKGQSNGDRPRLERAESKREYSAEVSRQRQVV